MDGGTQSARCQAEQAAAGTRIQEALALERIHPEHPLLVLEIGNVYLNRLKDDETAAKLADVLREVREHVGSAP